MELEELKELLELKGWTVSYLAKKLDVTYGTVYAWLHRRRRHHHIVGPAAILMRHWLAQARREQQSPAIPS